MPSYAESINKQYGRPSLFENIITALESEVGDSAIMTQDDLSRFDQLHIGGRRATRKLAELANIKAGMKILDIGCGVGGPARILAAEFGCKVIGIDLTESYVQTANKLTERVALSDSVSFISGNALDLEFDAGTFDVVWSQNAIMNIEDKKQLFTEINRVLRKDGILAIEAMMAGNKEEIRFPVYWADSPHVSFIITPDRLRQVLMEAGFDEITWMDVTPISIELGQKVLAASTDFSQPVGIHLVYSDVPLKAKNTFQGLEDGTYLNSYGVFRRQLD